MQHTDCSIQNGPMNIVYCAVGGRSATAVSAMQQMGFSKVHNLTSGYTGWSQHK
jgi:rhodanese-related sulfurtransferase